MWSLILLMTSRLPGGHPCLRNGDRKSSVTNSRQSDGRHHQGFGADRTQWSSTGYRSTPKQRKRMSPKV